MKMKRNHMKTYIAGLMAASLLTLAGCGLLTGNEGPLKQLTIQEKAHLSQDPTSPCCNFNLNYTFLNEKEDSIAAIINRHMQNELLGNDYANLAPEAAVDSFKNTYLRNYLSQMSENYQKAVDYGVHEHEIAAWFGHEYALSTTVEDGCEGVTNVKAHFNVHEGGAHPHEYSRWMNFSRTTGKPLGVEQVFLSDAKAEVEQLLLGALMAQKGVQTLDELKQAGYLEQTAIYIPDNFLLGPEGISFLYNAYDIAPHSAGNTVLQLSYEEIGQYLNK